MWVSPRKHLSDRDCPSVISPRRRATCLRLDGHDSGTRGSYKRGFTRRLSCACPRHAVPTDLHASRTIVTELGVWIMCQRGWTRSTSDPEMANPGVFRCNVHIGSRITWYTNCSARPGTPVHPPAATPSAFSKPCHTVFLLRTLQTNQDLLSTVTGTEPSKNLKRPTQRYPQRHLDPAWHFLGKLPMICSPSQPLMH